MFRSVSRCDGWSWNFEELQTSSFHFEIAPSNRHCWIHRRMAITLHARCCYLPCWNFYNRDLFLSLRFGSEISRKFGASRSFLVWRRLFELPLYLSKAISYFLPVRILFKLNHEIASFRPIFNFLASGGHRIPWLIGNYLVGLASFQLPHIFHAEELLVHPSPFLIPPLGRRRLDPIVPLPNFAKVRRSSTSSFINYKIKGSVSLVVTEANLFLRCSNHHTCCNALVCTENSENVIDFAVFIVIFREVFLKHLQSTKEKDIKDLKKVWCKRGICRD
jgi:hypothetical protein